MSWAPRETGWEDDRLLEHVERALRTAPGAVSTWSNETVWQLLRMARSSLETEPSGLLNKAKKVCK